jgi:hypothetical protein
VRQLRQQLRQPGKLFALVLRSRIRITIRNRRPRLLARHVMVGHRVPGSLVHRRSVTSQDWTRDAGWLRRRRSRKLYRHSWGCRRPIGEQGHQPARRVGIHRGHRGWLVRGRCGIDVVVRRCGGTCVVIHWWCCR